jgi:hypothetical protein
MSQVRGSSEAVVFDKILYGVGRAGCETAKKKMHKPNKHKEIIENRKGEFQDKTSRPHQIK